MGNENAKLVLSIIAQASTTLVGLTFVVLTLLTQNKETGDTKIQSLAPILLNIALPYPIAISLILGADERTIFLVSAPFFFFSMFLLTLLNKKSAPALAFNIVFLLLVFTFSLLALLYMNYSTSTIIMLFLVQAISLFQLWILIRD